MHKRKIGILVFIIFIVIIVIAYRFSLLCNQYADAVLANSINLKINKAINEYLDLNSDLLDNISTHRYSTEGKLNSVEVSTYKINRLKTELSEIVTLVAQELKNEAFYVPIGNLINIKFISGGPRIKINIVPIGSVSVGTINKIESVGINHTTHKIALEFKIKFNAAMPFENIEFNSTLEICLYESLIIGEVPNVYFK